MKLVNLNKEQLNSFITSQEHSQFLQSWEWGEFQERCGNKIFKLGVEDEGKLVMAITLIKKVLPVGKAYFYTPRIQLTDNKKQITFLLNEIQKLAKKENVIFLRFEPATNKEVMSYEFQVTRTIDVQPSKTVILDLNKSEEGLLRSMHQKTRYNIRLAERRGVVVREGCSDEDFEKFWDIMKQTKDRDQFRSHNKEHYKKMLSLDNIKLFLAEFDSRVISANIVSFFGDMVTYMHGASSDQDRNVMAPYLLQWHVIRSAKEKEYKYYDLYGIDEKKWPGVTRFKKGFCGEEIDYPGTFDIIFDKCWYGLYKFVRRVRRMI